MVQLDYQAMGYRIRKARTARKMTQEKLGEVCGLSTAHIGHIERGTRIPSLETLLRISRELEVSADWLLQDSVRKPAAALSAIGAGLAGKDPAQTQKFLSAVRALADKIDEL